MRLIVHLIAALLLVAAAGAPATAQTLDEVIAKHVEARGGKAAWEAIDSLKITGTFSAFSKVHPFTMHRQKPDRYHMDTIQDDKLVVTGYDGETPWWDNHWLQEGAQEIRGADLPVLKRDVDFIPPLMNYKERGFTAKLIGPSELEGIETIAIELTRDDESVETWHLDPKTFLEVGRISPGSDFGRAMDQTTFYDDFRKVAGVVMPFYSETQWYTRDRQMQIEDVQVNVDIDAEMFKMPLPPGMGPLRSLSGTFKVAAEQRQQPGAPWQPSEYESTFTSMLRGGLLQETFTSAQGVEVVRNLTYDRFSKKYRLTQINGARTLLDVHEGDFDDEGKLVVSNLDTGTTWSGFGLTFHGRTTISEIGPDGFKIGQEISTDGGENWFLAARATYTRAEE